MIREEAPVTYHTVTLGTLNRDGTALAEITEQNEAGEQHTRTLHVPAGLPEERVTIAVEASMQPPKRRRRHWKARPPRVWITEIHNCFTTAHPGIVSGIWTMRRLPTPAYAL